MELIKVSTQKSMSLVILKFEKKNVCLVGFLYQFLAHHINYANDLKNICIYFFPLKFQLLSLSVDQFYLKHETPGSFPEVFRTKLILFTEIQVRISYSVQH